MGTGKESDEAPKDWVNARTQNLWRYVPFGTYYVRTKIGGKSNLKSLGTQDLPGVAKATGRFGPVVRPPAAGVDIATPHRRFAATLGITAVKDSAPPDIRSLEVNFDDEEGVRRQPGGKTRSPAARVSRRSMGPMMCKEADEGAPMAALLRRNAPAYRCLSRTLPGPQARVDRGSSAGMRIEDCARVEQKEVNGGLACQNWFE